MRLAPILDLTSYLSRRYTALVTKCECYPGTRDNGWDSTHDENCTKRHPWIIGIAPGFYPWTPLE